MRAHIWRWATSHPDHTFQRLSHVKNAGAPCSRRMHSTRSAVKSTQPSSSAPPTESRRIPSDVDRGYLAFTKASLYKLTLPLAPPSPDASSPDSMESSPAAKRRREEEETAPTDPGSDLSSEQKKSSQAWEQQVEDGLHPASKPSQAQRQPGPEQGEPADDEADEFDADAPAHSVMFLLHSGQPLSYIETLIRAEGPSAAPAPGAEQQPAGTGTQGGIVPISFHTRAADGKRWSASTGIGDFLRDAARIGSFVVRIGARAVAVDVPGFEARTRFLRAALHAKTGQIERFARVKGECDRAAHKATQRIAVAGAGVLGSWWLAVSYLTFHTSLGWDTMEPITYLTGLGTVITSYLWFLWHNREVSYRSVLTASASRRQQKLYLERGFNIERYHDLIDEVKDLRKAIKRIAWDYDLSWEQENTRQGKEAKRALKIVRKEEERESKNGWKKQSDDANDVNDQEDSDGDGQPDSELLEDEDDFRRHWGQKKS